MPAEKAKATYAKIIKKKQLNNTAEIIALETCKLDRNCLLRVDGIEGFFFLSLFYLRQLQVGRHLCRFAGMDLTRPYFHNCD